MLGISSVGPLTDAFLIALWIRDCLKEGLFTVSAISVFNFNCVFVLRSSLFPRWLPLERTETALSAVEEKQIKSRNTVEITSTMVEEGGKRIQTVDGQILVHPPEDVAEDVLEWTIIYQCRSVIANKIRNPLMEEALSVFRPRVANMTFYSRGVNFETLELQVRGRELLQK